MTTFRFQTTGRTVAHVHVAVWGGDVLDIGNRGHAGVLVFRPAEWAVLAGLLGVLVGVEVDDPALPGPYDQEAVP